MLKARSSSTTPDSIMATDTTTTTTTTTIDNVFENASTAVNEALMKRLAPPLTSSLAVKPSDEPVPLEMMPFFGKAMFLGLRNVLRTYARLCVE